MKFAKPTYDAAAKLYTCKITESVRFSSRVEGAASQDPHANPEVELSTLTNRLIGQTKGWFSKPLTQEFLSGKVKVSIPTLSAEDPFEGSLFWKITELVISKDVFLFKCEIVDKCEDEKICIDFPADEELPEEIEDIPLGSNGKALGIGPTRQQIQKEKVLQARTKAARALFKAERMTQEYCDEFGQDTDWEDENTSDIEN